MVAINEGVGGGFKFQNDLALSPVKLVKTENAKGSKLDNEFN